MEFEQFKDSVRETRKKRLAYGEQLSALNTRIAQEGVDQDQLEEIIKEAKRIIQAQNLDNKVQVIRDIITKVIVKGGQLVQVRGRLPLFALNMGYEPTSRNTNFTFPYLEFRFGLTVPNPRYGRIITKRDELGRIVNSKPHDPVI